MSEKEEPEDPLSQPNVPGATEPEEWFSASDVAMLSMQLVKLKQERIEAAEREKALRRGTPHCTQRHAIITHHITSHYITLHITFILTTCSEVEALQQSQSKGKGLAGKLKGFVSSDKDKDKDKEKDKEKEKEVERERAERERAEREKKELERTMKDTVRDRDRKIKDAEDAKRKTDSELDKANKALAEAKQRVCVGMSFWNCSLSFLFSRNILLIKTNKQISDLQSRFQTMQPLPPKPGNSPHPTTPQNQNQNQKIHHPKEGGIGKIVEQVEALKEEIRQEHFSFNLFFHNISGAFHQVKLQTLRFKWLLCWQTSCPRTMRKHHRRRHHQWIRRATRARHATDGTTPERKHSETLSKE